MKCCTASSVRDIFILVAARNSKYDTIYREFDVQTQPEEKTKTNKRQCQASTLPVKTTKPSYRWQARATRKPAKIAPIRRAYNVVADNTGLSSCV